MDNKKNVTWKAIDDYIDALKKICAQKGFTPSGVYGIPRGGLVFAVMISYRFNIPLLMAPAEGCIIVDDIADSGRTLLHFTVNDTQQNNYFITTMYYHKRSLVVPDFWFCEKKDDWIVFPFE